MAKEGTVKALGIITIIFGGLSLFIVSGLILALVAEGASSAVFLFYAAIIISPLLWIIGGIGLLKFKSWARILIILLSLLSLLSFLTLFIFSDSSMIFSIFLFQMFPIGTILSIVYLIFLFQTQVKSLFNKGDKISRKIK